MDKVTGDIWIEKYRPKSLSEMVGQEAIVDLLRAYVVRKSLPHLLFAGPPGTGKTTAALALAHDLFGAEWRESFLELNASVTGETPVRVRIQGRTQRTTMGDLATRYLSPGGPDATRVKDVEILSVDRDHKVGYQPVSVISRHRVSRLANILVEGGSVRTSLNHSVMILDKEGRLAKIQSSELKVGDFLLTFREEPEGRPTTSDLSPNAPGRKAVPKKQRPPVADPLAQTLPSASRYNGELEDTPSFPSIAGMRYFPNTLPLVDPRVGANAAPAFALDSSVAHLRAIQEEYAGQAPGGSNQVLWEDSFSKPWILDAVSLTGTSVLESGPTEGGREARVPWSQGSSSPDSALLPSRPFCEFLEGLDQPPSFPWRSTLRHSLSAKRAPRARKSTITEILDRIDEGTLTPNERESASRWRKLAGSDLYPLRILAIEEQECHEYVYDVSVPGGEMFWGGTVPLLLHNSDERGIDTVRGTIKNYARSTTLSSSPFKLLFLDEADMLTSEAQASLRRLMERYASLCRFVISCNYSSRIIPPIQSRCAVFRFRPLKAEDVKRYLGQIAKSEGKTVEPAALDAILHISQGDMRQSVNILQQASAISDKVDADTVYESSALPMPKEVEGLITSALEGHFREARDRLQALLTEKGASGEDILRAIHGQVQTLPIDDLDKMRLIDYLAEMEFRLTEGASPRLQIEALLARLVAYRSK